MTESRSDGFGVSEAAGQIGPHHHLCVIWETQEQQFAAAIPFVRAGLEHGEKCLYIADAGTAPAALKAMSARGIDAATAIETGALTVVTENEAYLRQGCFDPDAMISFLAQSVSAAKAAGYSALRFVGEMTWSSGADAGTERLIEYESKLNHFLRDYDASAICLYDHKRFSPEVILGVLRTHPTVVYGGLVYANPYYIPPDELLKPVQPGLEVERLLNHLRTSKRAEEAVRRSQERWRAVFENSGVGIALAGPDGVFTASNRAYQEMVGYTEEELRALCFLDITYEEDRPANQALARELWEGKVRGFQHEKRYRRKDGKVIWVRNTVSLAPGTETVPRFAMAIVEDITERNQAEEALRRSEDRYRDLVEHSRDLLCTHNLEGQLLSVNRAAAKALGYEPDELLRKPLPELLAPEVREEFAKYISAVRRDGVAQGLMLILTRSGERRIWEYHNTLRVEGVPAPIVRGMARDVTERLLAERTIHSLLRISEKLNSTLDVDTLMNSLILEAMKLTDSEIGWSGLATERGMVSTSCVRGSQVVPFEYCWPPGVGWPGWVLAHKVPYVSNDAQADRVIVPEIREQWGVKSGIDTPILDTQGEVIGFFDVNNKQSGAYTDSDVEKMVAVSRIASVALQNALSFSKLRETEKSLSQLSDRLLRAQDEERRRIARELHDATAQSLAALAINLGVVSESDPGLEPKTRQALADSFDLVETCTREIRTISYLMHPPMLAELGLAAALRWYTKGFTERSGIPVDMEIPPELGGVPDDEALTLYRVVQESLTNIHRHSGSRAATIRMTREPHRITLSIADRGRGMPSGVVGDGSARPRTPKGVGVGVQGMRERVRQLGGQLEIQSGKKGTTVTVILPLSKGG
jgi:PAS domain S-box-containing protein